MHLTIILSLTLAIWSRSLLHEVRAQTFFNTAASNYNLFAILNGTNTPASVFLNTADLLQKRESVEPSTIESLPSATTATPYFYVPTTPDGEPSFFSRPHYYPIPVEIIKRVIPAVSPNNVVPPNSVSALNSSTLPNEFTSTSAVRGARRSLLTTPQTVYPAPNRRRKLPSHHTFNTLVNGSVKVHPNGTASSQHDLLVGIIDNSNQIDQQQQVTYDPALNIIYRELTTEDGTALQNHTLNDTLLDESHSEELPALGSSNSLNHSFVTVPHSINETFVTAEDAATKTAFFANHVSSPWPSTQSIGSRQLDSRLILNVITTDIPPLTQSTQDFTIHDSPTQLDDASSLTSLNQQPKQPLFPHYIYSLAPNVSNFAVDSSVTARRALINTSNHSNRTCNDIFDAYNCTCPPGFNGSVCQYNIDDCTPQPCLNNGTCVDGINSYECQCPLGFTGTKCEIKIDPCLNNKCLNDGVCKQTGSVNYTCQCDANNLFVGEHCQIPINYDCDSGNICLNNGTCQKGQFFVDYLNMTTNFNCQCLNGYEGLICEKERDFCLGHQCVYGDCNPSLATNNYTCTCKVGYNGNLCDQDIDECQLNSSLCLNDGICRNTIGSYACECPKAWTGQSCEIDVDECSLEPSICLHGGVCTNLPGAYACDCNNTGYKGPNCDVDIDECWSPDLHGCTEMGTCVNTPGGYTCVCHQGFSGSACETADCSLIQCQNNGTCQVNQHNNTWRCICSSNSYGLFCENLSSCLNKPCESGICYNRPNPTYGLNYTCECDANHSGPNCSEPAGACLTNPCGGANVTCLNVPNLEHNLNFTCVCPDNSPGGPTCTDHCANNQCVNGPCVSNPLNYTCQCLPGFSGPLCQENNDDCIPNPCNNSGKCIDGINSFQCVCDGTGYEGPLCAQDVDECLQAPCLNNGTCVNLAGTYRCDCPEFLGTNCEVLNPCVPNPCQNGGTCRAAIANSISISECICTEPFTGDLCQLDPIVKPLAGQQRRRRSAVMPIVVVVVVLCLSIALVALIAFILTAKKKRATRGAYSPSKQEITGTAVTLDHVLKPPPEERLI